MSSALRGAPNIAGVHRPGPYEYPEGCVVFASFRGLSARHRYDGSPAGEI